MAKSRRFQPGDSAPDFSHLADHEQDAGEPQWLPPDDGDNANPTERAAEDQPPPPPQRRDEAADEPADPSAGESHVFFEADVPVSADELTGETAAYAPPVQRPEPADESPDEHEPGSVLNTAPDIDELSWAISSDESTGLTDVGIPVFVDPPGVEDAADADDPAPPDTTEADTPDTIRPAAEGDPAPQADEVAPRPERPRTAASEPSETSAAVVTAAPAGRKLRFASRPRRTEAPPASPAPEANDRQRLLLILLASYASAITLGFLWLWLAGGGARPHELESLPDVAPLGPNEYRYAPENASMPKGHTLPLGDEQQLGYLKVVPLRVTRGPVEFAHYSDATQSKPPTGPTLKLWLRFTNVSSDQLIAPLDANLLLTRNYNEKTDNVQANQLLLPADKISHKPAFVLDHPTTSEWDLAGQQLGHRLKPGESLETYIPLEPGSQADLQGELLWRVHFRKGYHAATGHGVTTMIEVPFSTADIQPEPATAS